VARELFEQDTAGGDRIGWLELQLRRARDKVSQLEAIVAESNRQIRNFTERLNEMSATLQEYSTQVETTRQVHAAIGRLKEQVTALDENQQAVLRQAGDATKLREAQARSELQERGLLAKRLDEVERQAQALDGRLGRNVDFERKVNERLDAMQRDFDVSRRELLSETERNRVQLEQFRRIDEQVAQLEDLKSRINDMMQQVEVRQVEQGRAEGRIADLEQRAEDTQRATTAFLDRAGKLEKSMGSYIERMTAIEKVVDEGRKGVSERLLRFAESQEQQRRRQIEDLQREIRELRRYAARLREDGTTAAE
jgi:chromosome segregation ATPase